MHRRKRMHVFSVGAPIARPLRWVLGAVLALVAVALIAPQAQAGVGSARTAGPSYDRNPSVVQDGAATYLFFARTQGPCNRLDGCNPDNGASAKYDLYYKKSLNGGKDYGPATLAAVNPEPATDWRGRTIAATREDGRVLVFWADGGSQRQLYVVEKPTGSDSFTTASEVTGVEPTVFNVEAVTRGTQTYLYTEGMGLSGYGVYARTYTGGLAGPAMLVSADKNIPKAVVDVENGMIRLTYVDASGYPEVDVYVNSSADGLAFAQEQLVVDAAPGESNWDPNLAQKPNGDYYLHFAPDRQEGAGKQQIALTKSNNFVKWSKPHDITPGEKAGVEYWDYWPEAFVIKNKLTLYYTSERGFDANPTGTAHIWTDPGEGGLDHNPQG
jgi:hypothetical protein